MITLKPHRLEYAERMFELSSVPQVKEALGLKVDRVEDTKNFIQLVSEEEGRVHSCEK